MVLAKSQIMIETAVVDCELASLVFFLLMGIILREVDVGYQLHGENTRSRSVLVHCLHILVLTQFEQTFDPFNTLWRYITSDGQQLRRLDLVSQQPIYPRQLEYHIGFIWRKISQELQILDRELNLGERLGVLGNGNVSLPCIVSFQ